MGTGASKNGKAATEASPANTAAGDAKPADPAPAATPATTPANAAVVPALAGQPSPKAQAKASPKAKSKPAAKDAVASASQVVGGCWSPPKGPSPEDDKLVEDWKSKGKLHVLEGVWCAVPYKVTVVPAEGSDATETRTQAQKILDAAAAEAEAIFSHFVPTSEVSQINKMPADQEHKPSAPMKYVLSMANVLNRMTRGAFDPAILPVAKYYKESQSSFDESVAEGLAAVSKWSMFKLEELSGLKKSDPRAMLDLCGLAKGWTIDEMSKKLQEAGFTSFLIDWGGDIKVLGKHPAGRNWTAAIREPPPIDQIGPAAADAKANYLAHIELRSGQSIATSGDYLQTLGDGLSHIVNPKSGQPREIDEACLGTVAVVSQSCMLADALATAAMANGTVKSAREMLDGGFRGQHLKDPVTDYLLYTRQGPRVMRMQVPAFESREHGEDRLARHTPAHVVIVGGGLAGASAAIEAVKARAKVTILEKDADLGGNSAKATSGINACGTRVQHTQGVEDDGRFFERDTHVSAKGGTSGTACVTMLAEKSAQAIHWLIDELGVQLTVLSQLGGCSRKRTHRCPPSADGSVVPVGYVMMQHFKSAIAAIPYIELKTSCTMTKLLQKEGVNPEVRGVEYKDETGKLCTIECDAVVLTTGGFGYDKEPGGLMAKHRPDLVGVPTTNNSCAVGDGVKAAEDLKVNLIDMDQVQLHPTAFIDPKEPNNHTKYLGPEALRGSGGILLDQQGKRFVNELDLRSVVSQKILSHCQPYKLPDGSDYRPYAWCVLNEAAQDLFGKEVLAFYKDRCGLFEAAENTKGLAELIGCSEDTIVETLRDYAAAVDAKICQKTGKVVFPSKACETDTNFIVARITPCIHYTMGGMEITPFGEVLTTTTGAGSIGKRKKVRRLFAAGECTGGVHGGNRLGGNSLLECVVFGRNAGQRAATINQPNDALLAKGEWVPVILREVRETDSKYGHNTEVYRFALHGSMQHTGLEVGRFVAIRGEVDGDTVTGYYSPISRPDDEGIIDILCRNNEAGGPIVGFLQSLRPGNSCLMKGMGGPSLTRSPDMSYDWTYQGRKITKISLLSGGTGLAPALQIARAYFHQIRENAKDPKEVEGGIKLVYAAETAGDLAFTHNFDELKSRYPDLLSIFLVLNKPPKGWTQGVGFVDADCIRSHLWFPPADDHLLVMCGPPVFEKIMCSNLAKMGFPRSQYYSFAEDAAA